MKMAKKFLGLMMIAVIAVLAVACETQTCATAIECGLVGEWEAVDGNGTIEFTADGEFTSSVEFGNFKAGTTLYAKQIGAGYITISDEDGNVVVNQVRYYFDGDKLILGRTAYERKN